MQDRARMYLSFNNNEEVIEFPALPPNFAVNKSSNNETVETLGNGEITLINPIKQFEIDIKSVFPHRETFLTRGITLYPPIFYIKKIDEMINKQKPLRFVFLRPHESTGFSYKTNVAVSVESFSYDDINFYGDIEFELKLRQFRFYKANYLTIANNIQAVENVRPTMQEVPATYFVNNGETLETICVKFYGSSDWKLVTELKRVNGFTDYDTLQKTYVGKVIKLFERETLSI